MKATHDSLAGIKALFKRYPKLYRALIYIFAAQPQNATASTFVRGLSPDARIINVGSGPRILRSGVVNIDVQPFEGVDIVADAEELPFESESIDAAVCDNVLEHVRHPERVVAELLRVLRPGGQVYVAVPFVIPYHSSPSDFYRWSEAGLREMLLDFEEVELKIQYGPSAAFTMVLCEWLALLFSFNSKSLHTAILYLTTVLTAPLKLFDYVLVHYRNSHIMPLTFYFIGTKR